MVSPKEHEALQNQYYIAIAKAQDLQEQLRARQKQWEQRNRDFDVTVKLARELCEGILAKDPKEMVLGADYSWDDIPVNELILKARKVFQEYIESRKDFMGKIMDISEERRQAVESLKEQLELLMARQGASSVSEEESGSQGGQEKKGQKIQQKADAVPEEIKTDADSGKLEVLMDEQDDFDFTEEELYKDIAKINARTQITPKSVPVTESKRRLEHKARRKENAMKAHVINLKEYEEKLDETGWMVMESIGKEGVSTYSDIEASVLKKEPDITANKIRVSIGILFNIGLIHKEPVKNPLKGTFYIHQLTAMGSQVYKDRYGLPPIPSEMDKIMAEHDNCVHGYGIKFVAEVLRENGEFQDVCDANRKNPIDLGGGSSYVPDIVCTDKNGLKMYIEYECANHTQTNFNAKCNKMCKASPLLNFIVPNRMAADKMMRLIGNWIENRGAKSLRHVTVRVTGAFQLKGRTLSDNRNWKIVYQPERSREPHINF